jgi:hypothetical protein
VSRSAALIAADKEHPTTEDYPMSTPIFNRLSNKVIHNGFLVRMIDVDPRRGYGTATTV